MASWSRFLSAEMVARTPEPTTSGSSVHRERRPPRPEVFAKSMAEGRAAALDGRVMGEGSITAPGVSAIRPPSVKIGVFKTYA